MKGMLVSMKKQRENTGITLVALVITIIVLLILAGVTIGFLFGDNGIINQAQSAKDSSRGKEVQEFIDTAVLENEKADYSGSTVKTKDDVISELQEQGDLTDEEVETLKTTDTLQIGSVTVDFSELGSNSEDETYIKKSSEKADSYVGYYADINDDGKVDGIIYADLAVGNTGSGQWGDEWGIYDIPIIAINELKDYVISTHTYTYQTTPGIYGAEGFGTKEVIVPAKNSTGTKDRFYVMSLEDFTTKRLIHFEDGGEQYVESNYPFYWYKDAFGRLDNTIYEEDDFGKGKENTYTMIDIWNSEVYGEQDDLDMWGVIQEKLANDKEGKNIVWFVPSKSEWSAFGEELGITSKNYSYFGLSPSYWSSSQLDEGFVYDVNFYTTNYIDCSIVSEIRTVMTLALVRLFKNLPAKIFCKLSSKI
jgi:type II secretory pathway pseudopilin PulG